MALIDTTYFKADITLPASVLSGTFADINDYIAKYEKEALIDLLGYTLYDDYIDNPTATRWTRFVTGYEYEVSYAGSTHKVKWLGLTNTDKVSLLAYYVYYQYLRYHITHTSAIGELLQRSENATKISPHQRLVNAWNKFIELRGTGGERIVEPTAYNFLFNFESTDYDSWLFKVLRRTNTFGL